MKIKPTLTWYNVKMCIDAFDSQSITADQLCKLLYITKKDLPLFISQFKLHYKIYTDGTNGQTLDILLAHPFNLEYNEV